MLFADLVIDFIEFEPNLLFGWQILMLKWIMNHCWFKGNWPGQTQKAIDFFGYQTFGLLINVFPAQQAFGWWSFRHFLLVIITDFLFLERGSQHKNRF